VRASFWVPTFSFCVAHNPFSRFPLFCVSVLCVTIPLVYRVMCQHPSSPCTVYCSDVTLLSL
jgi:hypothetical protein